MTMNPLHTMHNKNNHKADSTMTAATAAPISTRSKWHMMLLVFFMAQVAFLLHYQDSLWNMTEIFDGITYVGRSTEFVQPTDSEVNNLSPPPSTPLLPPSAPWLIPSTTCDFDRLQDVVGEDDNNNNNNNNKTSTGMRIQQLTMNCTSMVVYGVAMDATTLQHFHHAMQQRQNYSTAMLEQHGRCFFLFTASTQSSQQLTTPSLVGHYWVVPIDSDVLSYPNPQQNANFVKYSAPKLYFEGVRTIVHQDPATFFTPHYLYKAQPKDYTRLIKGNSGHSSCLSAVAMPLNQWTVGSDYDNNQKGGIFQSHCRHLQSYNPNNYEVDRYCQHQIQRYSSPFLDQAMVSTQFLIWRNHMQPKQHPNCRQLNHRLQCDMLSELHQHNIQSDTLVFPAVAAARTPKRYHRDKHAHYNRQINELYLFDDAVNVTTSAPRINLVRSNCHWSHSHYSLEDSCNYWKYGYDDDDENIVVPFPGEEDEQQSPPSQRTIDVTDDHTCTSPEANTPFPLQGDVQATSIHSNHTCGLKSDSSISKYLRETVRNQLMPMILDEQCHNLVVYGVALGNTFVDDIHNSSVKHDKWSRRMLREQGRCFVMFVSQKDVPQPILKGHFWMVPIPQWVLPYQNNRRNAKLLKYIGSMVFTNTTTVIWQDAKFFNRGYLWKQPKHYDRLIPNYGRQPANDSNDDDPTPCLTAFALPVHPNTVGAYHPNVLTGDPHQDFRAHCNTIVRAIRYRPNVTDSTDSVSTQCISYVRRMQQQGQKSIQHLNNVMVDTAFMIWNQVSPKCRAWNNAFRCSMLSEIHCHSDRDQIPWPYVLNSMDLQGYYDRKGTMEEVNDGWNPKLESLELRSAQNPTDNQAMVKILPADCHWYNNQIGKGCSHWRFK